MNDKNKNKINEKDNISKTKKKKPSKFNNIVSMIFYVNVKILSYALNIVLTVFLIGIITGGIVAGTFALYIKNDIDPSIDPLTTMSSEKELTTYIYYYDYEDRFKRDILKEFDAKRDNRWKEMDKLYGAQNSTWVKYRQIPANLVNAFRALEDRRFFEHNGVDWRRTAAAGINFFIPFEDSSFGGSTITQQLVKLMTENDEHRIQRKIQEMLRAMTLESGTSKSEIMETYLNTVSLSTNCVGVQAAANTFFNKDVSELNLIECAAIAAIVQSPTAFNPIRKPERNKERRNACLKNMLEYGYITEEEYNEAYDKELVINRPENSYVETVKSYYVDQIIVDVQEDLMKKFNYTKEMASNLVFSGGLEIYSCMDKYIQDCMENVYKKDEFFPEQSAGDKEYQSSMVILDHSNGDILGIVGGRGDKVQRGLNRASGSRRQPGSATKPVSVYAPALDRELITWGTPMDDSPAMELKGKLWPPNYPAGYEGGVTLKYALAASKNTAAVKTLMKLTPYNSFRFMYDELNVHSLVEELVHANGLVSSDIDIAPMSLGGLTRGVSALELTGAYTMLANDGIYSKPRSYTVVKDQHGNIILDNRNPDQKIVISEETASIMTRLLMGVVESGTARYLPMKNKIEVAGKTGTTNDDYDRWFVGYTPYYACGVWFGYDKNKFLGVGTGATNPPMLLFHYVMDKIHEPVYDNPKKFEMSPMVVTAEFCRDSGMAPGPYCSLDPRGNRIEMGYFARGGEPAEPCDGHVRVAWDESTGAVAGPGCPSDKIKYIALVRNEDREFPNTNPYVGDAQYTYREVGQDYIYPTNINMPFYFNLLPENTYSGTSGAGRPINSFCIEHNHDMSLPVERRASNRPEEPATEIITAIETPPETTETTQRQTEPEITTPEPPVNTTQEYTIYREPPTDPFNINTDEATQEQTISQDYIDMDS